MEPGRSGQSCAAGVRGAGGGEDVCEGEVCGAGEGGGDVVRWVEELEEVWDLVGGGDELGSGLV